MSIMTDSVLVIGSGGREHALAWKLSQSSLVQHVFVAPGNAGTTSDSTGKISNSALNIKNHEEIVAFCAEQNIKLVVVGPEDPLANGLADYLSNNKLKCFGPCQKAAQIEASKDFAKSFMERHKIPTAKWKSFNDADEAKKHIMSAGYEALVVKASGLAAGKGVIVADSRENAVKAVDSLRQDKSLSSASETIIIEELLEGEETSVLCFSDGIHISVMPPAQDHKRLLDGDLGLNTGGMGAYCRCPQVSDSDLKFIEENVLQKAIDGMRQDGYPYVGVLYAGLMMTKDGPKVLEFNCRFGDPETQVILPLLNSDLYQVMLNCVDGSLDKMKLEWSSQNFAVGVVVVSGGYPGSYPKGKVISGLEKLSSDYIVFHAGTALSSGNIVTSGGRVLAVVAVEDALEKAAAKAQVGASLVQFEGAFYRKDIAHKALKRSQSEGMTYSSAGVDIASADALVEKIKVLTKQTSRSGLCGDIGGFGGIFDLKAANFTDPILVSRGCGIGEKLMAAQECEEHQLIGYDLVANCVNEILCHGAEPLFFLDTFTTGKLDTSLAAKVIEGIVKGCKEANCALIGGETAEMPGMYSIGDFDLTGFARGAVERSYFLPNQHEVNCGDSIIALLSSSINSSGFGIIRKLLKRESLSFDSPCPFDKTRTMKQVLLSASKVHVHSVLPILQKKYASAACYMNEGGLSGNLARILPAAYKVLLDSSTWAIPEIFLWIQSKGNFKEKEMLENFNCGIDLVLVVKESFKTLVLDLLRSAGEKAVEIGSVQTQLEGESLVEIIDSPLNVKTSPYKVKVAAFVSGEGLNTLAVIKHNHNPLNVSSSEIALVVSESQDCQCVLTAQKKGIESKILNLADIDDNFESSLNALLESNSIEIICLDNFSVQLPKKFLEKWHGRIISIHSSLLPAFDVPNPHKEVLSMKTRITGCTAYFVNPEKNFGGVIDQAATYTSIDDTEESLKQKVSQLEQYLYPQALEYVASKRIVCNPDSKITQTDDCSLISSDDCCHESLHQEVHSIINGTIRTGFVNNYSLCGLFDLKESGYEDPYLVSGTDGVGTKLKIAQVCNKHETIGIDLVAMCVNDILTHGAEPLFFMETYSCGKLNPDTVIQVLSGIAEGCKQANCSLISSEISVLPEIYLKNKSTPDLGNYDVVGYAEGALSKDNLLPRKLDIGEDDTVIGLASSGIHSNGYSLVRKIVQIRNLRYQDPAPFDSSRTLGEVLLTPTKIYVNSLLPLMKKQLVKAAAHITGGGITENIPRVLPSSYKVVIDGQKWTLPPVLRWIAQEGQLSEKEMLRTFNCGLGMVLIVDKQFEKEVLQHLKACDETAATIGKVQRCKEGEERVTVQNFCLNISSTMIKKKRVGVLISGSGTNLQALIDYTQNPNNQSKAEIVLVLSNVPEVEGLKRAQRANIPTKVLSHKAYKSRVEFDMAVNEILQENGVEIVCLAGFMRILSKEFVNLWQGKLLNVHPAILPAFKGVNAHKLALEYGARVSGCTVHFVEAEVDAGAIIEQAAVRVDVNDTEKSLQEKVKVLEHQIFPAALELLASGRISRGADGKLVWNY